MKKNSRPLSESERNVKDCEQSIGNACANSGQRLLAALGKGSAQTKFEPAVDLKNGGLMLALPALSSNGLFKSLEMFNFAEKYYRIVDVFISIAFMVLSRIDTINQLDRIPAGEWGRLMGLDRIPEKKCLRAKLDELSSLDNETNLDEWISERSNDWINPDEGEAIGNFYLDGHVRTYFGEEKLPRRYVARQKLCMRGLTDYWVNDAVGNPFSTVTTPFTKGLVAALKDDIIPKLIELVPAQTQEDIDSEVPLSTIIFDREGYGMTLFKELWDEYRIACQTYHKFPKADWAEAEFKIVKDETIFGTTTELRVAEKEITPIKGLQLREVRCIADDGHQVSVISKDFRPTAHDIITHQKSRVSQENFFRYGRRDFNIDTLASYSKVSVDDTIEVVNPASRQLVKEIRSTRSKLGNRLAKQQGLILPDHATDKQQMNYEAKQGDLTSEIEELTTLLSEKVAKRKITKKHIKFKELPDDHKFKTLHGGRKKVIDIIKMICYRAEVSMANIIMPSLSNYDKDTARAIVKSIFQGSADMRPDYKDNTLHIRLHHMNNRKYDNAVKILMEHLNQSEFIFPATELKGYL